MRAASHLLGDAQSRNAALRRPSRRGAPTLPKSKPERFRWIWERDRPGRPGRRLAGQSYDDSANTIRCGTEGREGFRRDAENGGRDDRAPQSNCIVPAKRPEAPLFLPGGEHGLEMGGLVFASHDCHFDLFEPRCLQPGLQVGFGETEPAVAVEIVGLFELVL